MLVSLNVKNFAIIDNLTIDFNNKMTVLTGETGAGKSLIIDAIGLLFGDRSSADLVKHDMNKATIEGIFDVDDVKLNSLLLEYGIEIEEQLIIKREIYSNGKSLCRINSSAISLSQLQEISNYLGDIHTQFDTIRLINPKNYLSFIDNFDTLKLIDIYKKDLKKYRELQKEYNELINRHHSDQLQFDFLKYQYNEIEKAKLSVDEELDLKKQFDLLNNTEIISSCINNATINLNEDILSKLYETAAFLEKIENYDSKYFEQKEIVLDSYYNLTEVSNYLSHQMKSNDDNNLQLSFINERLGVYSDLKRKYKMNTEELITQQINLKNKIENFENYDSILEDLEKQCLKMYDKTIESANNIREQRMATCLKIQKNVTNALIDLKLTNTKFEIKFNEIDNGIKFNDNGIDEVDFMVSFNKGEPTKSLSKVASGGELSRFMLALKTILIEKMENKTIIFDEIDSGVSGSVAYSIASKIKEISKKSQVLCVTHLPQVAAISDYQVHISKTINDDNKTKIIIKELDFEDRIIEIAKMISNNEVTQTSKEVAKELLTSA